MQAGLYNSERFSYESFGRGFDNAGRSAPICAISIVNLERKRRFCARGVWTRAEGVGTMRASEVSNRILDALASILGFCSVFSRRPLGCAEPTWQTVKSERESERMQTVKSFADFDGLRAPGFFQL